MVTARPSTYRSAHNATWGQNSSPADIPQLSKSCTTSSRADAPPPRALGLSPSAGQGFLFAVKLEPPSLGPYSLFIRSDHSKGCSVLGELGDTPLGPYVPWGGLSEAKGTVTQGQCLPGPVAFKCRGKVPA